MARVLACLLALSFAGCAGISIDHNVAGKVDPFYEAQKLEENKDTIAEVFQRLGPPDLILRARDVDRAYYTYWDSDYFKFVFKIEVPLFGRGFSYDVFVFSLGGEQLYLARLDFSPAGMLLQKHVAYYAFDRSGEYAGLDNTIVTNFLEDRNRALHILQQPDDDEKDLPSPPPGGQQPAPPPEE